MNLNFYKLKSGAILVQILVLASLASILISALASWSAASLRSSRIELNRELAFQIAEAGIEYYRWHLAVSPTDFQDGTGQPGPYVHNYLDKNGNILGTFSLEINPPITGSTLVTIRSTGVVAGDPDSTRSLEVQVGKPSLAKYSIVTEDHIWFTEGTEVFGPIHSNGGIRFDGIAHSAVSSGLSKYKDPAHSGGDEFAVHTHVFPVDPVPPADVPSRPDVFRAGRQFPVPAIDFGKFTNDLSLIKAQSQSGGVYLSDSGKEGYRLVLKTDDTFDLYRVTALVPVPNNCHNNQGQFDWGTWSIKTETFLQNMSFPSNGLIFAEDDIWVEGQIDGHRITIATGRFPENKGRETHITVNNDLKYTYYDGSDSIALVAQGNINVGLVSSNILRIDAALMAKNDRVGRYYYPPPSDNKERCSPYHQRDTVTLYGMIGTNKKYAFNYADGSGYQNIIIIYDANLLFSPPPNYLLTKDQYQIVSWKEIK
jgi:type II secretory pathway pseudopilin PulG